MKRIEFIGARGGHGTTTVALATAATLAQSQPTRLASHDRQSLCATIGIDHHDRTLTITDNLQVPVHFDGDVCDAGTLEAYLEPEPFPDPARDNASEPLRIAVLRGPDYLGLRTLCAVPEGLLAGVVVIDEPGRSLDERDVEQCSGLAVVAVIEHNSNIARTVDAGIFVSRVGRLCELDQLRRWITTLVAQGASCVAS